MSKDKGVSFVENWSRVVKDIGSFRFKRGENLEIFTDMFPGFPKLDEGYKVKLSKVGDSFLEVATFGDGTTFTTPWKYDEEAPFLGISYLIQKKGKELSQNLDGVHQKLRLPWSFCFST